MMKSFCCWSGVALTTLGSQLENCWKRFPQMEAAFSGWGTLISVWRKALALQTLIARSLAASGRENQQRSKC